MKSIRTLVALCSVISVLAACGGGDGNDLGTELGISKPQARFINAVPAGPNLDYYLNAKVDASGVAYKGVTRYHDIDSGGQTASYDVSGTNTTVASQSFNAANGHHYTTIALPSTSSARFLSSTIRTTRACCPTRRAYAASTHRRTRRTSTSTSCRRTPTSRRKPRR